VRIARWVPLALLALTGCTRGPKGLSRSEYPAIEKGFAAFQRAFEYRDAGTLIFDPRMLDAERALDEAKSASSNPHDTTATIILESSIGMLNTYRRELQLLRDIGDRTPTKESRASYDRVSKLTTDVTFSIKKGMAELWSYL
jgi:hypothetical protein